jgi:hypothetical protein
MIIKNALMKNIRILVIPTDSTTTMTGLKSLSDGMNKENILE